MQALPPDSSTPAANNQRRPRLQICLSVFILFTSFWFLWFCLHSFSMVKFRCKINHYTRKAHFPTSEALFSSSPLYNGMSHRFFYLSQKKSPLHETKQYSLTRAQVHLYIVPHTVLAEEKSHSICIWPVYSLYSGWIQTVYRPNTFSRIRLYKKLLCTT